MGIYTRKTLMRSSAALLLCVAAAGPAAADSGDTAPLTVQTADIGDTPGNSAAVDTNDGPADDSVETPVTEDPHNGPLRCDNPHTTWYAITGKSAYFIPSWWSGTEYKDGPGGTMNVSVTKTGTISASITGGTEAEGKIIVAKAKVSVSATIGGSFAIAVGHQYTHDVTKNKYGHLQYGSWGYNVSWAKYSTSSDGCGTVKIKSGTAKLPTNSTGWKYWETSS
ncbi:hypothetical protein ACN9M0_23555 [Streptomyces sp. R-07]|uniref:hypothetical protein n=1 Tax=unclassified Streptomyces TaxID=2593676 RepID=UPI0034276B1E